MNGEVYKRTNNKEATDYFLSQILTDYGVEQLKNAIKAANEYVKYYEGLGLGKLKGTKSIISKYEKIIHSKSATNYPDEFDKSNQSKLYLKELKKR